MVPDNSPSHNWQLEFYILLEGKITPNIYLNSKEDFIKVDYNWAQDYWDRRVRVNSPPYTAGPSGDCS